LVASELHKEAMARLDLGSGSSTGDASCFSVVRFAITFTSFSGAEKRTPLVLYVLVCVETPDCWLDAWVFLGWHCFFKW
jgi:hypothetical protein